MGDAPRVRAAARVLVVDPAGRGLLFGARLLDLSTPPGPVLYWYTPGGEVEPGEPVRRAAARELAEEIGLLVDPAALEGPAEGHGPPRRPRRRGGPGVEPPGRRPPAGGAGRRAGDLLPAAGRRAR